MTASASPIPPHLTGPLSPDAAHTTHTTPRPPRTLQSPNASPHQSAQGSPRNGSPRSMSTGPGDVEGVLRAHGGDMRRALEATLLDRNNLQAQNSQLWKLIEKQRAQCAQLAADNERIRADRERANGKLSAAGLEPVMGKRMTNSSSAVGLGLRAEAPQIRRHNSDRDEKGEKSERERPARPTLQVPPAQSASSSPDPSPASAPPMSVVSPIRSDSAPPSATSLLPSPLVAADTKLRRESRMAFPPEVSSFMTLADSPRNMQHTIPTQIQPSTSATTMSPSSLYSESASESGPSIPPPSSRSLARTTETVHEEPDEDPAESDRASESSSLAPPIMSPPARKESLSPIVPRQEAFAPSPSQSDDSMQSRQSEETTPRPSTELKSFLSAKPPSHRLAPDLLAHTRLSIPTSTVYPNALGRDVLCFIVCISIRPPNAPPSSWTTWNVAKLFSAFIDLDTRVKAKSGKQRKEWKTIIAPLPDGRTWKDFAPSKIDQRKKALEAYIQSLLVAPLSDKSDLCEFLNTDRVHAKLNSARKEGYLTKKGKNFGGWKTRFFVLDGPVMEYFESRGGAHLGSIVITNAQIGRQNRPSESSDERDFRHAFLIIEQSKKGPLRHVLCADSDSERDSWIDVLVRHVEPEGPPVAIPNSPAHKVAPTANGPPSESAPPPYTPNAGLSRRRSNSRKSSKDVVVTSAHPIATMPTDSKFGGAPSPSLINSLESKRATQQLTSSPSLPSLASHTSSSNGSIPFGSNPLTLVTSPSSEMSSSPTKAEPNPRLTKRQSMMPAKSSAPPSHSAAYLSKVAAEGGLGIPGMLDARDKERDRKAKSGRFWPSFGKTSEKMSRPVFGVPLEESIAVASVASLPAIVFRCIEYLEAKKAENEEGLYRLSGSSAVIKGLKEKFDNEGDVNLLKVDNDWDPHAIAGLLKTYLRELPQSLLTRDLHPRFLAVMDLIDSSARVSELSRLVSDLPPHNYALLRSLTAHLILIVRNCPINKMTLRNIGIVFSPTLGIPAGIFSELVSHFGAIFDDEPDETVSVNVSEDSASLHPDEAETDETVRRKRNSMLYQAGGADAMLGLGGRSLDPALEDSASDADTEEIDGESEAHSILSEDHGDATPRAGDPQAAVRRHRAPSKAAERGLMVDTPSRLDAPSNGYRNQDLTGSPRQGIIG